MPRMEMKMSGRNKFETITTTFAPPTGVTPEVIALITAGVLNSETPFKERLAAKRRLLEDFKKAIGKKD